MIILLSLYCFSKFFYVDLWWSTKD